MNKKSITLFYVFLAVFLLFFPFYNSEAFDDNSSIDTLKIGGTVNCGDTFTIKLVVQPVIGATQTGLRAEKDYEYLIIRAFITNKSNLFWNGFTNDSFKAEDIFQGKNYFSYPIDSIISAKTSEKYRNKPYFRPMKAGSSMETILGFRVFPDVDSWILHITPKTRGMADPICDIRVKIPNPLIAPDPLLAVTEEAVK